ncbi:DUF202 domain-containing protein [bacterium]|nr:DUF202 domain-containing protein [bacterium]
MSQDSLRSGAEVNSKEHQIPEDPRIRFAAEQAQLAWVRTALSLMGFGFVVDRFGLFLRALEAEGKGTLPSHTTSVSFWIGITFIILGVVINVVSAVEHFFVVERINKGEPPIVRKWPMGTAVSILLAVIGAGMTTYLIIIGR